MKFKMDKSDKWIILGVVICFTLIGIVVYLIVWGIISSEMKEDKREWLCAENGMYYDSGYGYDWRCCSIIDDGGILCYKIIRLGERYYLQKNYKNITSPQCYMPSSCFKTQEQFLKQFPDNKLPRDSVCYYQIYCGGLRDMKYLEINDSWLKEK